MKLLLESSVCQVSGAIKDAGGEALARCKKYEG